jgi:hypothetical protein
LSGAPIQDATPLYIGSLADANWRVNILNPEVLEERPKKDMVLLGMTRLVVII